MEFLQCIHRILYTQFVFSICKIIILSGCISITDFYELVSKLSLLSSSPSLSWLLFTHTMYFMSALQSVQESNRREKWRVNEYFDIVQSRVRFGRCGFKFLLLTAIFSFFLLHLFRIHFCILPMLFMSESALII